MQSRNASVAWRRAVQIGVLGLIWGIGILAVAVERAGSAPAHAARPACGGSGSRGGVIAR